MPLSKLGIKHKLQLKGSETRGTENGESIIGAMIDGWDSLQQHLSALDEGSIADVKQHFNKLINGEDELGDALFGSVDDFTEHVGVLEEE